MRKYDDNELKEVLEGFRSKAMKAEVEEMFAALRMTRVRALERRRCMFEMIENCNRVEDGVKEGRFDEANPKLKEVKLKEVRLQASFAGEMLPLIEMGMRIMDSDFEEVLEVMREKDERMVEEEREYEGDEGLTIDDKTIKGLRYYGRDGAVKVKDIRDLN